jgi:hypothetical protein
MSTTEDGWGGLLAGLAAAGGSVRRQLRSHGVLTARLTGFGSVGLPEAEDPAAPFPAETEPSVRFLAAGVEAAARADARLDAAAGPGAPAAAHLGISSFTGAGGARSLVASVPGTDVASLGSLAEPNGLVSIADNFVTDPQVPLAQASALMQLIDAALVEAGSDGLVPVLLAGFSQGGMAVLSLAGNREFLSRHQLAGALTLGAPSRHYAGAPESVRILDVAERNDPVAGLDAGGPEADPGSVVVRVDAGRGILSAHSIRAYAEAASQADEQLPGLAGGPEYLSMLEELLPRGTRPQTRVYGASSELLVGGEPVGEAHRHAPGAGPESE